VLVSSNGAGLFIGPAALARSPSRLDTATQGEAFVAALQLDRLVGALQLDSSPLLTAAHSPTAAVLRSCPDTGYSGGVLGAPVAITPRAAP
jgi:hypothetical protein